MKSTQRTQWILVPWAKAGARRAARIPSMPPATPATAAEVLMNVRRLTWVAINASSRLSVVIYRSLLWDRSLLGWVNRPSWAAVPFGNFRKQTLDRGTSPGLRIAPRGGHERLCNVEKASRIVDRF